MMWLGTAYCGGRQRRWSERGLSLQCEPSEEKGHTLVLCPQVWKFARWSVIFVIRLEFLPQSPLRRWQHRLHCSALHPRHHGGLVSTYLIGPPIPLRYLKDLLSSFSPPACFTLASARQASVSLGLNYCMHHPTTFYCCF